MEVIDLLTSSDEENDDAENEGIFLQNYYKTLLVQDAPPRPDHQAPEKNDSSPNILQESDSDTDTLSSGDYEESCNDNVKSLEFLRNHCWACHVWIHHPGFDNDDSDKDEICYNALHLHPILKVPVCVVCAETIEAAERKQQSGSMSSTEERPEENGTKDDEMENNATACIACGKVHEGENLRRCSGCTRTICQDCSRQAYHTCSTKGDSNGLRSFWNTNMGQNPAQTELPDKNCLFCCSSYWDNTDNNKTKKEGKNQTQYNLPIFLHKLQRVTRDLFSSCSDSNGGNGKKPNIEDVLDELYCLEKEKQRCELKLDNTEELLDDVRDELWVELSGPNDDEMFKIRVQQEYQERRNDWTRHHTRLLDRISILGDRLKSQYGIEATAALRYIEATNADVGEHESYELESKTNEPTWKVAADNELNQREIEERSKRRKEERQLAQKRSDDPKYRIEITEDAEDLGSCDGNDSVGNSDSDSDRDSHTYDNGWRNAPFKARKEDVEAAKEAEDKRRVEEGKSRLIIRNRKNDMREFNEWDAGLKSSATSFKRVSSSGRRQNHDRDWIRNDDPSSPTKQFLSTASQPLDNVATNMSIMIGKSKRLQPSSFVLSRNPYICIPREFEGYLKDHQKEGIKFIYKNSFSDLGDGQDAAIGGCILAHSMGLGKSLSCVSILYAIMMQPSLFDSEAGRGKIHKALLVVPVNTIANWENEFDKWTKGMKSKLPIFNISSAEKHARKRMVDYWSTSGGVLLTPLGLFRTMANREDTEKLLSTTDVIILDESHTMLKNKGSQAYKALIKIKTPRRICLTGTPFQNNLLEYYRMASFIRPKLLGNSEKEFQKEFIDPIQSSMGSDAPEDQKLLAESRLTRLVGILEPFIHRRDASLLSKDLPSLQQVCIHVSPTKIQRVFYGAFREHQEVTNEKNFLKQYAALRTVHNHPGTLLFGREKKKGLENKKQHLNILPAVEKESKFPSIKAESMELEVPIKNGICRTTQDADAIIEILDSEEEEDSSRDENYDGNDEWWTRIAQKVGWEKMKRIESGNKCLILLHMLAHAAVLGEKTIVFSQSLKTLDFLSEVIASKHWQKSCPSIKAMYPDLSIGGWIQGKDFLRIDGSTSGIERGELLKDFSDDQSLKLFLISSVAGGIGINLVSASRVILFDSHFNPTIDLQAIYRCYRYGQKRNVFAYRLLTQGSMEEKVYSRAMNKLSLGNRVIDGKKLDRCFEKDEIAALSKVDDWVECVKCGKWRMFPPNHSEDIANLPSNWYCELMNKHDARMQLSCKFAEKDSVWYYQHFKKPNEATQYEIFQGTSDREVAARQSSEDDELIERDEILQKVLAITSESESDRPVGVVNKLYFHDTILTKIDDKRCIDNDAIASKDADDKISSIPTTEFSNKRRKLHT